MSADKCECGKPAPAHSVYNGKDQMPVCCDCWRSAEAIHTEVLVEFNISILQAKRGGEPYRWLHDWMDPNQLLADLYEEAWDARGMAHLEWEEYTNWMNRASELYDEWYAKPGLPEFRPVPG